MKTVTLKMYYDDLDCIALALHEMEKHHERCLKKSKDPEKREFYGMQCAVYGYLAKMYRDYANALEPHFCLPGVEV